jgi:hypothetical protein
MFSEGSLSISTGADTATDIRLTGPTLGIPDVSQKGPW